MSRLQIHGAVFAILLVVGAGYAYYILPPNRSAAEVIQPLVGVFLLYLAIFTLIQFWRRKTK
jgi:amino acid permease